MEDKFKTKFASLFAEVQAEVNATAHEKGWYDSPTKDVFGGTGQMILEIMGAIPDVIKEDLKKAESEFRDKEDGTRIGLMHSELSEALEGLRHGNPASDKIGDVGFSQVEEEFADTIIRIMDVSQERGWRIGEAIEAKRAYNKNREYRHGGKKI